MRQIRISFIAHATSRDFLLAGVLLLASGCNQAQPFTETSQGSADAATADGKLSETGQGRLSPEPELDENAVNEDGFIVLGDPGAADSLITSAESDSTSDFKGQDQTNNQRPTPASLPATSPASDDQRAEPSKAASSTQVPATLAANTSAANTSAANTSADSTTAAAGAPAVDKAPAAAATRPASKESLRSPDSVVPAEANVASSAERNQSIAEDWPEPQVVLFVSGQQHGYLEPCGCTGLENQKGGLIRRDTLLSQLKDRDWTLIPIDVGNQVRRIGPQPEIKFQSTVEAFKLMGYRAATLGIDDLKLSSIELISAASSDELNPGAFISANVSIIDPSFFPSYRIVDANGRKIGITAALGMEFKDQIQSDDIEVSDPVEKLRPVVEKLKTEGCDFLVLLAHASIEESSQIARDVPGFDLVVTAGGYGEPTLLPEQIDGSEAMMVQVGTKGMYGGIVGLFDDEKQPVRYQKIAISSQFRDSVRMLDEFAKYQEKLRLAGYDGLGVNPISHPTGRQYVGSETCGECHSTAYDIWENSPHVHATDSIVAPPNDRGGIARHYDPECISCHVTGWNPQSFYPYESGWMSLEHSEHLAGSGCENCHGPGKSHVDAENGDVDVDNDTLLELRQQMVLKLENARDRCLECHDLDNSPDFHDEGAFDEYWEQVKHYGKD